MTDNQLTCLLHVNNKCSETVRPFDQNTWAKVKEADIKRHQLFRTSKYFAIILPDLYNESTDGYHPQCYKNFTALHVLTTETADDKEQASSHVLRSKTDEVTLSSTGVFPRLCLFCNNKTKYAGKGKAKEQLGSCETVESASAIKKAATILKDEVMQARIIDIDMIAKEVKYHHSCRKAYLQRAQRDHLPQTTSTKSDKHSYAFEQLRAHIQRTLIENEGAELLTSLHAKYMGYIHDNESSYSAQSLCQKIIKTFPALQQTKLSNKSGIVMFNCSLTPEQAIRRATFDEHNLKETAFYLRSLILGTASEQKGLPNPITAEGLAEGIVDTPLPLLNFFRLIVAGSETLTEHTERQAQALCDDVMFITSRGKAKPAKHLCLGLGIKSLTGSRRIIEILNRFGHCISYHTIESIETELATTITERHHALPDGMAQQSGLCTGLAWDNYDENNETLSGSETLHDTVGICYQNMKNMREEESQEESQHVFESQRPLTQTDRRMKKLRSFQIQQNTLEPYRKKPKVDFFQYSIKENAKPLNLVKVQNRDTLWMIMSAMGPTPMWTGWNSQLTNDPLPKQKVLYMNSINLPPTRLDVVLETMKISQKVARECGEENIIVHYDLAIAKPALQIQAAESPRFDNLFIAFGPFHICLAYFGALGYIIESSGGPEILTETDVLAPGSLNGFLSGRHYNR